MQPTPDPTNAMPPGDGAGWQAFFVHAHDPLAADDGPVPAALSRLGIDAHLLRVFELHGTDASQVASALGDPRRIERWLVSSPAAVRHLHRVDAESRLSLFGSDGALAMAAQRGRLFAPGPGTAATLQTYGVEPVVVPAARFDSEGLLALPALAPPLSGRLAIVSAPGGRGLLQEVLSARGANVLTLHVYRREDATPLPAQRDRLATAARPVLVASSLEALQRLPDVLPEALFPRLARDAPLVVASERLSHAARTLGFRRCHVAGSALADDLATAVASAMAAP